VENVKNRDYESYLQCLVFPENIVRFAFAIKAFHVELAMVPDQAKSDANITRMRYKFWLDSINDIYKGKTKFHPTLMELSFAITKNNLSKEHFYQMIDSRCVSLDVQSMKTEEEFLASVQNHYIGSNLLMLELLQMKSLDSVERSALQNFGKAQGIVSALKGIRYLSAKKQCEIPRLVLSKYNINERDLFRLETTSTLRDMVQNMAEAAQTALTECDNQIRKSSNKRKLNLVFLPKISLRHSLKSIRKSNFDIYEANVFDRSPFLPLMFKMNSLFRAV